MALSMLGTLFQNQHFKPLKFGIKKKGRKDGGVINKRVVWEAMLPFRVWTYINIEITCKNSGFKSKKLSKILRIRKSLEFEIWPDLSHKDHRNSLNF